MVCHVIPFYTQGNGAPGASQCLAANLVLETGMERTSLTPVPESFSLASDSAGLASHGAPDVAPEGSFFPEQLCRPTHGACARNPTIGLHLKSIPSWHHAEPFTAEMVCSSCVGAARRRDATDLGRHGETGPSWHRFRRRESMRTV